MRNEYKILIGKPGGNRNHLGGLSVDGTIILKWVLNKYGVMWTGFMRLRITVINLWAP
jgi:hypothetical protein